MRRINLEPYNMYKFVYTHTYTNICIYVGKYIYIRKSTNMYKYTRIRLCTNSLTYDHQEGRG